MARDPLVVVILKIPFRVAVSIKAFTSSIFGSILSQLFSLLILLFRQIHFRSSIIQTFLSGTLKLFLISTLLFSIVYPIWHAIIWTTLSDYPILLIPLILIQIISTIYLLKKSANSIPLEKRKELGEIIYTGFYDLWGLVLTIILVLSLIGIAELNFTGNPDDYVQRVYKSLKYTIVNIMVIPKLLLLLIVPWRLFMYLANFRFKKRGFLDILREVLEGFYDVFALICLVYVVLGLIEVRNLWDKYQNQVLTRAEILKMALITIFGYFFLVLSIVNLALVVRAYAMINDMYDNGKLKSKDQIVAVIIKTFVDTLTFPIRLALYVFLLIGIYRLKNITATLHQAISSSTGCEVLFLQCKREALMQVKDFYYGFLMFLSLPFVHRSIPALLKIGQVEDWHSLAKNTFFSALFDIPTVFFLIFIFASVVRVPLLFKRRNFYEGHLMFLCLNVMREIMKDLFVLPYLLFNILAPWRFYYLAPRLYKAVGPKEQRKILKDNGILPVSDYLTIILTSILILSLWRTFEVLSIVVTHVRQIINNEPVNSSLLKKIFKKFLELILDVLLVFMILIIFLFLTEVYNFTRRIRTYYYLYKDRRGFQYKKYFQSIFPRKKTQEPIKSPIQKLNRNVFTEISSFLDLKSLTAISEVNRKFRDYTNFQPIWKFKYENQWKEHLNSSVIDNLTFVDDYKELVKKAYEEYNKQNFGVVLNEEERDYKMGVRVIVLEEFALSIFGFVHIISMPAKIFCYLISKVDIDLYFQSPRYPRLGFQIMIGDINIDRAMGYAQVEFKPDSETLKSFNHIQLNFVFYIIRISTIFFEQLAFFICSLDFFVLKMASLGRALPLNTPGTSPRTLNMKSWMYFIQLFILILMIISKITLFLLPAVLTALYKNYNWLWIIFGPLFIFIPYYFAFFCNLSTIIYYHEKFYNFNPHFVRFAFSGMFNGASDTGKKLYRVIKKYCIKFNGVFWRLLGSFKVLIPSGTIFNAYKKVLIACGTHLKKLGYLGDFIFTPLTLVWIFWPLLVPYYLNEMYLLIPIFPIEIFLIIKGYSTAKLAWKDEE